MRPVRTRFQLSGSLSYLLPNALARMAHDDAQDAFVWFFIRLIQAHRLHLAVKMAIAAQERLIEIAAVFGDVARQGANAVFKQIALRAAAAAAAVLDSGIVGMLGI